MKILLCNDSYPLAVQRLEQLLPGTQIFSCAPNEVAQNLDGVDVIIPSVARITSEIIERGTFGFIQQLGVGLDPVDIDAATKYGGLGRARSGSRFRQRRISSRTSNHVHAHACSPPDRAEKESGQRIFFKPTTQSLLGKTVCIVGLGDIGTCLARRLKPFGMTLKAVRKRTELPVPEDLCIEKIYSIKELAVAVHDADYVVLAVPETGDTRQVFNADIIAAMKPGSYLVNVAREAGCLIAKHFSPPCNPDILPAPDSMFSGKNLSIPDIRSSWKMLLPRPILVATQTSRFLASHPPLPRTSSALQPAKSLCMWPTT